MLVTLKGLYVTQKLSKLYLNILVGLTRPSPKGYSLRLEHLKDYLRHRDCQDFITSSAMLVTLKGLYVTQKLSKLYLNILVGLTRPSPKGYSLRLEHLKDYL